MFSLSSLNVSRYDVFTVTSERFWRERRHLITAFFTHIREVGSSNGFLATPSQSICREAHESLGITCVAGMHYRYDTALSKERWRILKYFLLRGQPLIYAGLDVRFVWPVHTMLKTIQRYSADAAFEGKGDGRQMHFTPDIAVMLPTHGAQRLLATIFPLLRARTLEGLPHYMRIQALLRYNLMGPAEQDLLADALLTTLHNRTVAIRKFLIASGAARESGLPSMIHDFSLPQCTTSGARTDGHRKEWQQACADAGVLFYHELPRLDVRQVEHGTMLGSSHLRVVLFGSKGARTSRLPCTFGCTWDVTTTLAFHCLTKLPQCLDLSRCTCLTSNKAWCSAYANVCKQAPMLAAARSDGTHPRAPRAEAFAPRRQAEARAHGTK